MDQPKLVELITAELFRSEEWCRENQFAVDTAIFFIVQRYRSELKQHLGMLTTAAKTAVDINIRKTAAQALLLAAPQTTTSQSTTETESALADDYRHRSKENLIQLRGETFFARRAGLEASITITNDGRFRRLEDGEIFEAPSTPFCNYWTHNLPPLKNNKKHTVNGWSAQDKNGVSLDQRLKEIYAKNTQNG